MMILVLPLPVQCFPSLHTLVVPIVRMKLDRNKVKVNKVEGGDQRSGVGIIRTRGLVYKINKCAKKIYNDVLMCV